MSFELISHVALTEAQCKSNMKLCENVIKKDHEGPDHNFN